MSASKAVGRKASGESCRLPDSRLIGPEIGTEPGPVRGGARGPSIAGSFSSPSGLGYRATDAMMGIASCYQGSAGILGGHVSLLVKVDPEAEPGVTRDAR